MLFAFFQYLLIWMFNEPIWAFINYYTSYLSCRHETTQNLSAEWRITCLDQFSSRKLLKKLKPISQCSQWTWKRFVHHPKRTLFVPPDFLLSKNLRKLVNLRHRKLVSMPKFMTEQLVGNCRGLASRLICHFLEGVFYSILDMDIVVLLNHIWKQDL